MSITFKQTNSNDLVEAVSASSTKKSGYEAFIASLNNLNSLPTDIKKKLMFTNLFKSNKVFTNKHIFNNLRYYLISSVRCYKYPNDPIFNLVDYITCLEYLVHQIDPIDPIYDIPEVKQVYVELFKLLGFNPEDLINEFKKIQKQCKEILDLTIEYKLNIINNYHKIIIQNNIFYINKELISQYGENIIKNYYSQADYNVSDFESIPGILFRNQPFSNISRFKEENLIKRSQSELDSFDLLEARRTAKSGTKKSLDEIKSLLKDCMSLPTYRVDQSFFKYPYLEQLENVLFSNLVQTNILDHPFNSWSGVRKFSEKIADILTEILGTVKVSLKKETESFKETKLTFKYDQFNPFPTMEFQKGCNFEKLINEYIELDLNNFSKQTQCSLYDSLISNGKRGTFHQIVHQRIGMPERITPLIGEHERELIGALQLDIDRNNIYGQLEIPLPLIDFGELSSISNVINKILTASMILDDEDLGKKAEKLVRYLYVKAEIIAYNTDWSLGKNGFLCAIDINCLAETLSIISEFTFISTNLSNQIKQILDFLDELKSKNIFEIYGYRKPGNKVSTFPHMFSNNNLTRNVSTINPVNSNIDSLLYSSNMGEFILNYPKNSIKAFGNKTIKEKIYNEYKHLTSAKEKDRFLASLFNDIHLSLGKNGNTNYRSESLESKGFNVPLAYISVLYEGNRYKFLLSDFSINFKKYQFIKYFPEVSSKTEVKKPTLIAGKTKLKSLINIPGKCKKDDILKYIGQVLDLKIIYNSGTNKFNKIVEVLNESNSIVFKTELKNLKIYVEESKSKRKASKN